MDDKGRSKSILEFDEALRRMRHMSEDHQRFLELVSRLKEIKRGAEDMMSSIRGRLQETDKQLKHADKTATAMTCAVEEAGQRGEKAVKHLMDVRDQVEDEVNKTLVSVQAVPLNCSRVGLATEQEYRLNDNNTLRASIRWHFGPASDRLRRR